MSSGAGAARHETTVAVVGAGLSGRTAARELHRRGIDVLVLESADRVGGRALTRTTSLGSRLDLGGQWIGHGHHRMTALARELGATVFAMHTPRVPRVVDGERSVPLLSPSVGLAGLGLSAVQVMAWVGRPHRWRDATVASWLEVFPSRRARRLLEVALSAYTTADLDRLTMHALTSMVAHNGRLRAALSTRGVRRSHWSSMGSARSRTAWPWSSGRGCSWGAVSRR